MSAWIPAPPPLSEPAMISTRAGAVTCDPAAAVKQAIADGEAELSGRGRLLIRESGTEPLIRVMAEGEDKAQIERIVDSICAAVVSAA